MKLFSTFSTHRDISKKQKQKTTKLYSTFSTHRWLEKQNKNKKETNNKVILHVLNTQMVRKKNPKQTETKWNGEHISNKKLVSKQALSGTQWGTN